MTDRSDPRLQDESRLDAVKRAVEDVAQDAPTLAKIALEAMIREHNPDLSGTADSAGRVGMRSGKVSELTAIARLKPGGAERLQRIFDLTRGNMDGAQRVSTLHDMRFVFFDDNTRILFATAYDGDWDADTRRLQRTEDAVNTFLDQMAGRTDLDEDTAAALKQLTDTISTPEAVDY